jgi:hypothetical protein
MELIPFCHIEDRANGLSFESWITDDDLACYSINGGQIVTVEKPGAGWMDWGAGILNEFLKGPGAYQASKSILL